MATGKKNNVYGVEMNSIQQIMFHKYMSNNNIAMNTKSEYERFQIANIWLINSLTRVATVGDFKTGTILFDSEGNKHVITDKYDNGIWNTRRCKVVFESEAKFYRVKIDPDSYL